MQLQKTLQDRAQDIPQDMTHDTDDQQTDLVNGIKDLTLDSKPNVQNSTTSMAPQPDMPEETAKGKDRTKEQAAMPTCKMSEQETQL